MPLVVTRMSSAFLTAISSAKAAGATEASSDSVSRDRGSSLIWVFLSCQGYAVCLTHDWYTCGRWRLFPVTSIYFPPCPARSLFGNHGALHRRQQGQQLVLRARRDIRFVHRRLQIFHQCIEMHVVERQALVHFLHRVTAISAGAPAEVAKLLGDQLGQLLHVAVLEGILDARISQRQRQCVVNHLGQDFQSAQVAVQAVVLLQRCRRRCLCLCRQRRSKRNYCRRDTRCQPGGCDRRFHQEPACTERYTPSWRLGL